MVEWTDFERDTIQKLFANMNYEEVGPAALSRCLVVYPWTQRYFGNFGNLYNAVAIATNPNIAKHGITILHGLDRAVKNMDNIKDTYTELSELHSEKLHVDPDNFRVNWIDCVIIIFIDCFNVNVKCFPTLVLQLLSDCLTIVLASRLGSAFTGDVQAAFQKFMGVVVSALGRQYH
ncbi:hemoglobin subunit beta-2-like isoform X1 [Antennarius striatus]|uniref:hemoglobin subunit beta-2-like isoform X1 n=1 Tax=Antennarius striatus TaxID=241820 RepID=UPI0035AE17D6